MEIADLKRFPDKPGAKLAKTPANQSTGDPSG